MAEVKAEGAESDTQEAGVVRVEGDQESDSEGGVENGSTATTKKKKKSKPKQKKKVG